MRTLHIETKLIEDGRLVLNDLPFKAEESVDVIVISKVRTGPASKQINRYPLRGKPIQYIEPAEPIADDDW